MKRYQALMLAVSATLGLGCDAKDVLGECEDVSLAAKVETFAHTAEILGDVSGSITTDVFTACNNIAVAMGDTAVAPATAGQPTDDEIKEACNQVKAGLSAQLDAGVTIEVLFEPAVCTVNAQASVDCNIACDVEASCDPGEVEIMCEGGELSVSCEGTCEGELSCEVSASAECGATCEGSCSGGCTGSCTGTADCTATCEGTCNGECSVALNQDGSCDGVCMGECKGTCSASVDCQGSCEATCEGSCEGKCVIEAEASCDGEVRCEGSCEGTATAPKCTGNVEPPSCTADAQCQGGCDAQASLEATCTEPSVTVNIDAEASADVDALITALEDNMPLLLSITAKGELFGTALSDTADAFGDVAAAVANEASCLAEFGGELAASAQASVEASVSVSVSVQASASVSGCASSGSGCDMMQE